MVLGFLLVLALMATAACRSGPKELQLTEADGGRTVQASPDQKVEVRVETNASIGYEWKLTTRPDQAVVAFEGQDLEADEPVQPGSGGTDVFRFRATGAGTTSIVLTRYFRDEGPDRRLEFTIRVEG